MKFRRTYSARGKRPRSEDARADLDVVGQVEKAPKPVVVIEHDAFRFVIPIDSGRPHFEPLAFPVLPGKREVLVLEDDRLVLVNLRAFACLRLEYRSTHPHIRPFGGAPAKEQTSNSMISTVKRRHLPDPGECNAKSFGLALLSTGAAERY